MTEWRLSLAAEPYPGFQAREIVARSLGISVTDFRCREHADPEGPEEVNAAHSIVLIRRGVFRRTQSGERVVADANQVLFFNAGEPYRISHPVAGGDDCTILALPGLVARELVARHSPRDPERLDSPFRMGHGLTSDHLARLPRA